MRLFLALIALLFLAAGDCSGRLYTPPLEDSCFNGVFANDQFSLEMNHESGQVWGFIVITEAQSLIFDWEGMNFIGKITETGRADGVLTLNFPDGSIQEQSEYSIYLEPSTGACNTRNTLRFPRYIEDRTLTLTRQP